MRPPVEASSPLAALLASVEEAHPSFASEVSDESPPGLLSARSLVDGSEDVAAAIRRFQASCGFLDRRVAGMLYVARLSWFAAGAVAVLVSAKQLPALDSDRIAFVLDLPRKRSRCLLRSDRVHALAGDAQAVARGADAVASVDDLHRILAAQFTVVVEPVVDAAAASCRLGRRGLWAMASSSLGNAFLAAGRHLDRTSEACEHMRGVLSHDQRLTRSAPIAFPVAASAGGVHLCRAACCLILHEPGHVACPTSCPLLPESIRRAAVESAAAR
jgi:hypothetical protein